MIIITALFPVVILLLYIYRKDNIQPEPIGQIVKVFLLGVLSIPLSFVVSIPLQELGFYSKEVSSIADAVRISFFGAAIPEELAKLYILRQILKNNEFFDEKMDGIVYAVCVSMGFAAFENITYLISNVDSYMQVGFSRALTAVPGHFCFGVIMGYYYSLATFDEKDRAKNQIMVIVAPVIVHGIYDSILFASAALIEKFSVISETVAGIISLVFVVGFVYFCFKMWKFGSLKIKEHIKSDEDDLQRKREEEFNELFKNNS